MSIENNTGESTQSKPNPIPEKSKIPNVTIINVVLLVGLLVLYVLQFYPNIGSSDVATSSGQVELTGGNGTVSTPGSFNIAYVNSDTLMANFTLAKRMKANFETEQSRLENDLKRKQSSFQADVESFQRQIQLNLISMEDGQAKEQELMQRQQELIRLNETYTNNLMVKEMEMNRELYAKITDLLERYNEEMNYDYILGFSPGGGILYAHKKNDITADILQRLNSEIMTAIKRVLILIFFLGFFSGWMGLNIAFASDTYALVIHGGAGIVAPESLTPEQQSEYLNALALALKTGGDILSAGGTSLDAVEAVVRQLEDSPLFNAGKGAVFNIDGKNEHDASIMCGATNNAGAVAGLSTVKNPISASRKVMENSPHVMLTGKSAELFAYEHGLEIVEPDYFFDQRRWEQYREFIRNNVNNKRSSNDLYDADSKMGTVGAVALDIHGNLAAATSTGGMTGKYPGRIGDSPIIGAGNYASNLSCGVSATGHGEFFIRNLVAYDIAARMLYKEQSLQSAASFVIQTKLVEQSANGGVIAIDKDGNIVMEFNTTAMFRGYLNSKGEKGVAIFK
jgi:L-asparaginase / beta-aspartyl-peptidase